MRKALVVADLGFGDAGKGTLTDYLVRRSGAGLVVRYNGGAQAGHTVLTHEGRRHTFAQIGAGAFVPGVRTHLSKYMVVHPTGLLVEARALAAQGVDDPLQYLSIDPNARIITPFQQAACRLREIERGAARHGSCGIGVGECVQDFLEHPADGIRAHELGDPLSLRRKLQSQQARKYQQLRALRREPEFEPLESADAGERWIEACQELAGQIRMTPDYLPNDGTVVFEGAQGVLLDEWRGFHPYTTWSTCTFDNAIELLKGWDDSPTRIGVVRAYATRHGAGPFPTEDPTLDLPEPYNPTGPWQGAFRVGHFDAVLTRYAIAACGGIDALALTHLDRVRDGWQIATAYETGELPLGPFTDLDFQETLTARLQAAKPIYAATENIVEAVERELGANVWITGHGPIAENKRMTKRAQLGALPM